jgi:hypothetical protein
VVLARVVLTKVGSSLNVDVVVFHAVQPLDQDVGRPRGGVVMAVLAPEDSAVVETDLSEAELVEVDLDEVVVVSALDVVEVSPDSVLVVDVSSLEVVVTGAAVVVKDVVDSTLVDSDILEDEAPSLLQFGSIESSNAISGLAGLSIGSSRLFNRLQLPSTCIVGSKTTPTQ